MTEHINGPRRALVTGGAGLIGSHVVDLLLREGWRVRILDNLEPQTHRHGKPAWIPSEAEFIVGDIRERDVITGALRDIDVVFHQAAYGGYMPEIGKYVHVNSFGTAQMLEVIREENLPVKKIVVASSQAVYSEGAAQCPAHGLVFPEVRPVEQLRAGDFGVHCPACGALTTSAPTPERAPIGGETVYAITKVDQERLVLTWGKQVGIPTVALRYSCTYGPRQSIFNPYTGVIAIFCTRLLEQSAAGALRGRQPDARLLVCRRHRPRQPARRDDRQTRRPSGQRRQRFGDHHPRSRATRRRRLSAFPSNRSRTASSAPARCVT